MPFRDVGVRSFPRASRGVAGEKMQSCGLEEEEEEEDFWNLNRSKNNGDELRRDQKVSAFENRIEGREVAGFLENASAEGKWGERERGCDTLGAIPNTHAHTHTFSISLSLSAS